jgi:MerR HTH family regulatory protein
MSSVTSPTNAIGEIGGSVPPYASLELGPVRKLIVAACRITHNAKSILQCLTRFGKVDKRPLLVSEAASVLGVTAATLRNWDRSGKLKSFRHPINGYRLYNALDIERLRKAISGRQNKKDRR